MDPMTAAIIGGAALNFYGANQQRKSNEAMNEAQMKSEAAKMQYSPLTNAQQYKVNMYQSPNEVGAAAQGALGGLSFAQKYNKNQAEIDALSRQNQVGSYSRSSMPNMYSVNYQSPQQSMMGNNQAIG